MTNFKVTFRRHDNNVSFSVYKDAETNKEAYKKAISDKRVLAFITQSDPSQPQIYFDSSVINTEHLNNSKLTVLKQSQLQ